MITFLTICVAAAGIALLWSLPSGRKWIGTMVLFGSGGLLIYSMFFQSPTVQRVDAEETIAAHQPTPTLEGEIAPLEETRVVTIPAATPEKPSWGFVGILPPRSRTLTEVEPFLTYSAATKYCLVDGITLRSPGSAEILSAYRWNGQDNSTYVYPVRSFPLREKLGNSSSTPTVMYVQPSIPRNEHQQVLATLKPETGVKQWVVTLNGKDSAQLKVPAKGAWRYVWVVTIQDREYWSRLGSTFIAPEGLGEEELYTINFLQALSPGRSEAEAKKRAQTATKAAIEKLPISIRQIPYQGVYVRRGEGEAKPLQWVMLEQMSEDLTLTFGLNAPLEEGNVPDYIHPAKIIVGISGLPTP